MYINSSIFSFRIFGINKQTSSNLIETYDIIAPTKLEASIVFLSDWK